MSFNILFAKEEREIMEHEAGFSGRIAASMGLSLSQFNQQLKGEAEEYKKIAMKAFNNISSKQNIVTNPKG
jgi:hypothetical protein